MTKVIGFPVLLAAFTGHCFLVVSLALGYLDGMITVLPVALAGGTFACWTISIFVVAGLFKRGQETAKKGE